jgi:hypothetical protein
MAKTDHSKMKLGKLAPRHDDRTLQFASYRGTLSPPSLTKDWRLGQTSWGMMENDNLGDCTVAGCGHGDQIWTKNLAQEYSTPDPIIVDYYCAWCGYVRGDSSTDNGGVEIDILNNWRKYGFGPRTHHQGHRKLTAYTSVNPLNLTHVKQAISLFGFVYIGLALPISAQQQQIWDVDGDPTDKHSFAYPGSWGGHCVVVPAYTEDSLDCITWGQNKTMTNAFWQTYVDEVYALLSPDWIASNGVAASGFDLSTLLADLKDVED